MPSACHRASGPIGQERLALEADRAETERGASRRRSSGSRSGFLLLGSSFRRRSRGGFDRSRSNAVAAAARGRRAAVSRSATSGSTARRSAARGRAAIVLLALALVAGFDAGVNGDQSDADDSQEQGNAESQSTIHSRNLHWRHTHGAVTVCKLLPSRRHDLGNRMPRTAQAGSNKQRFPCPVPHSGKLVAARCKTRQPIHPAPCGDRQRTAPVTQP